MSTTFSFQHINLEYLDTMTGGDAETTQQMLEMLIDEIPIEITKMQKAVASQDWEEVFQISHKLKTTFAFIGNDNMTSINKKVEGATRQTVNQKELLKEAIEELLKDVPSKVEELNALSKPIIAELKIAAQVG